MKNDFYTNDTNPTNKPKERCKTQAEENEIILEKYARKLLNDVKDACKVVNQYLEDESITANDVIRYANEKKLAKIKRKIAFKLHPDRNFENISYAEEKSKEVGIALATLENIIEHMSLICIEEPTYIVKPNKFNAHKLLEALANDPIHAQKNPIPQDTHKKQFKRALAAFRKKIAGNTVLENYFKEKTILRNLWKMSQYGYFTFLELELLYDNYVKDKPDHQNIFAIFRDKDIIPSISADDKINNTTTPKLQGRLYRQLDRFFKDKKNKTGNLELEPYDQDFMTRPDAELDILAKFYLHGFYEIVSQQYDGWKQLTIDESCDVIGMALSNDKPPTEQEIANLPGKSRSAFIITADQLFYVDRLSKSKNKCTEILVDYIDFNKVKRELIWAMGEIDPVHRAVPSYEDDLKKKSRDEAEKRALVRLDNLKSKPQCLIENLRNYHLSSILSTTKHRRNDYTRESINYTPEFIGDIKWQLVQEQTQLHVNNPNYPVPLNSQYLRIFNSFNKKTYLGAVDQKVIAPIAKKKQSIEAEKTKLLRADLNSARNKKVIKNNPQVALLDTKINTVNAALSEMKAKIKTDTSEYVVRNNQSNKNRIHILDNKLDATRDKDHLHFQLSKIAAKYADEPGAKKSQKPLGDFFRGIVGILAYIAATVCFFVVAKESVRHAINQTFFRTKTQAVLKQSEQTEAITQYCYTPK